jgi:division protein CdvB (Snf7/Vps24/ESCRT-III family)
MGQERLHDKRNNMSQLQNQLIQVTPAKAKLHVHKAGVQKILKILDTVFRRYDAQGLLQLAHMYYVTVFLPAFENL